MWKFCVRHMWMPPYRRGRRTMSAPGHAKWGRRMTTAVNLWSSDTNHENGLRWHVVVGGLRDCLILVVALYRNWTIWSDSWVGLGWLWLFHPLPWALADPKMSKKAKQLGQDKGTSQIKVNPIQLSDQIGHPIWVFAYHNLISAKSVFNLQLSPCSYAILFEGIL